MVESVMVIIPLMIAFLSVLQLSTGVMARTVSSNVVQGAVASDAISSSPSSISTKRFDLPGGGTFTIGSEQIHRPAVSPLLPGGDNYEATGMAITE
jgi:hypothetical protein